MAFLYVVLSNRRFLTTTQQLQRSHTRHRERPGFRIDCPDSIVLSSQEEGEDEEEPDEVSACKKAAAIATLYVALWSQIANGNHDLDLRRCHPVGWILYLRNQVAVSIGQPKPKHQYCLAVPLGVRAVQERAERVRSPRQHSDVTRVLRKHPTPLLFATLWKWNPPTRWLPRSSFLTGKDRPIVHCRAETSAAYRRVSRLYSKARELDAAFALPEVSRRAVWCRHSL